MSRDEKMWEAVAQEHGELSMRDALVTLTALEWADKTMIDKACEWLSNHIDLEHDYPRDAEELVRDFRKALED